MVITSHRLLRPPTDCKKYLQPSDEFNKQKTSPTDYNQSVGGFLVKFISRLEVFFAVGGRSEQSVEYDYPKWWYYYSKEPVILHILLCTLYQFMVGFIIATLVTQYLIWLRLQRVHSDCQTLTLRGELKTHSANMWHIPPEEFSDSVIYTQ